MAKRREAEQADPNARPEGERYRNLTRRDDMIYYARMIGGRRVRFSTEESDWDRAVAVRDDYEARKGIGRLGAPPLESPRLRDFAPRYLAEDTGHLAATTRRDRPYYLAPGGPVLRFLGDLRLDEITPAVLREWWNVEIERTGGNRPALAASTGRHYLNTLAAALAYAQDVGLLDSSPIPAFREQIRRRRRTKRGRAEAGVDRIQPIETPAELARLIAAAEAEGPEAAALVLLLFDAGLRLGEGLGLRWGSIVWGESEADPRRALRIEQTKPRGGEVDAPKSGRARTVALSRRLRASLDRLRRERWNPEPDALVVTLDPDHFRRGGWRRICAAAGLDSRNMKDLRDSFASHLLSAGVQLGYVSKQLGHADVGVTARHYARWAGDESYRSPLEVVPGEVPADLLARLAGDPTLTPAALPTDPTLTPPARKPRRRRSFSKRESVAISNG